MKIFIKLLFYFVRRGTCFFVFYDIRVTKLISTLFGLIFFYFSKELK